MSPPLMEAFDTDLKAIGSKLFDFPQMIDVASSTASKATLKTLKEVNPKSETSPR